MSKLNVCVIFGGMSTEHSISLLSAKNIIKRIDDEKYNKILLGITKEGEWYLYEGSEDMLPDDKWLDGKITKAVVSPDASDHGLLVFDDVLRHVKIDVVVIALHGMYGEDGTVQGLLDLAKIPYVGPGVLGSALCMDKVVAKSVFKIHGIPQADWIEADKFSLDDEQKLVEEVRNKLGFPVFVKASKSGSSIGAYKVKTEDMLCHYVREALKYDDSVLIEEFIDAREIESAVLGNEKPVVAEVGEVVSASEFYDFDAKYSNPESKVVIPAPVDKEVSDKIKEYAVKAYKATRCRGLSRVDFFVERGTGRIILNEINTLPGFTDISMYPMMWANMGLEGGKLIDELIKYAMESKQ